MLKIRSTPTEGKHIALMKEWTTETRSIKPNIPAIPYGTRDCATKICFIQHCAAATTRLDLPDSENFSEAGRKARL